jgi:hypothetical protein
MGFQLMIVLEMLVTILANIDVVHNVLQGLSSFSFNLSKISKIAQIKLFNSIHKTTKALEKDMDCSATKLTPAASSASVPCFTFTDICSFGNVYLTLGHTLKCSIYLN